MVVNSQEQSCDSLYHNKNRMHIVSFDDEESGPLKNPTDKFEMKFEKPGVFEYKCSIYTRMRGKIEVVDDE
jgi:plastocyanin